MNHGVVQLKNEACLEQIQRLREDRRNGRTERELDGKGTVDTQQTCRRDVCECETNTHLERKKGKVYSLFQGETRHP